MFPLGVGELVRVVPVGVPVLFAAEVVLGAVIVVFFPQGLEKSVSLIEI